jgi:hypothetical protein
MSAQGKGGLMPSDSLSTHRACVCVCDSDATGGCLLACCDAARC